MSAQLMSILLTNTSSIHFKSDTIITENESVDRFTERERKSEKKKEKKMHTVHDSFPSINLVRM